MRKKPLKLLGFICSSFEKTFKEVAEMLSGNDALVNDYLSSITFNEEKAPKMPGFIRRPIPKKKIVLKFILKIVLSFPTLGKCGKVSSLLW